VELDLEQIFADIDAAKFDIADPDFGAPITKAEFTTLVGQILAPLGEILGVFRTGNDLILIPMGVEQGVNGDNATGTDDIGLIKIKGSTGYANGLLPLLMGLGAGIPEVMAALLAPSAVTDGATLITAIVNPIMGLLDALKLNPATTLLKLLPNLMYMLTPEALEGGDVGDSILSQALVNILFPVTSLLPAAWPIIEGLLGDEPITLGDFDIGALLGDAANLSANVNKLLFGFLAQQDLGGIDILGLLGSLMVGAKTPFTGELHGLGILGIANSLGVQGSDYLAVNLPVMLASLLEAVLAIPQVASLTESLGDIDLNDLLRLVMGQPPRRCLCRC
jgi:hypothetical protein